jgi:4-amino-4-deoxy-L-arabinose transferase-like glycosyltransferase
MSSAAFRRALIGIAIGALVLRVIYAYAIVKSRPLLGDALEFQQQANLLADGHGYIQIAPWELAHIARPSADKPPLYPFLEAVISLLGGRTWAWHHIVDILGGTATVVTVGLLGRRVAGRRTGIIAAGLAAVYPLLIAADGSLRSETIYALLVTLALLSALWCREKPTRRRALALGAVTALAALTRGEALLLALLLPFAVLDWRRALLSIAACALVLSPWLIRCWVAFDQPVLISTNVGGLLAGANCPQTYSGPLLGQWTLGCLPPPRYTNEAKESDRLRDVGLRYAREHASRLPAVIAARLGRSFELFRPRQQWEMEAFYEGRSLQVERAGVIVYYLVAALALAGVVNLRRRRGPWLVLLTPIVLVVFVSITAYGFTRFRVGAEPALIVLASITLDAAVRRWGPAVTQRWTGLSPRRRAVAGRSAIIS